MACETVFTHDPFRVVSPMDYLVAHRMPISSTEHVDWRNFPCL